MMQQSGSPEAVAYALFERVCYVEGKDIGVVAEPPKGWERPSRSWIFSTYAECLSAVRSGAPGTKLADLEARPTYTGARRVPREAILASDPV
jgi:hypothetical protein